MGNRHTLNIPFVSAYVGANSTLDISGGVATIDATTLTRQWAKAEGDSFSDSPAGAGDDGNVVFEVEVHR